MRYLLPLLLALPVMAEPGDGWHEPAWRGYKQVEFPAKGWTHTDGVLHHAAKGGGGDIITTRRYRNFEFELQFKVGPRANSGIMYRVAETDGASYMTGPEFQVLDDSGHDKLNPLHAVGALYGLYAADGKTTKRAGEWNDARITMVGNRVRHWLNGVKVVDAVIGSDDWKSRIAKSKFAKWEQFGVPLRGHICLQDHGDDVSYRKIRVRELAPEKARHGEEVKLFTDKHWPTKKEWLERGWGAHHHGDARLVHVWSNKDGILMCKGKPAGYAYTHEKFKNFILKVQWRWPGKPGNSGVLFRMTGNHKVWPRSIEAQLHSGNAGDFWCIGNFPMKTIASRTRGRNTRKTHGNEKPVGEWNEYEIIVDGSWVQLRVNGQVLNEAWDCEEIAGSICLQSEGAPIEFRNVRVIPLR